jgi:L-ribulose-5-phosphate 3-epimerase
MKPMEVGVFLCSPGIECPFDALDKLAELGFHVTQLGPISPDFYTDENAAKLKCMAKERDIAIVGCFVGFPGESYASMADVKATVGFVFPEKLAERLGIVMQGIDFAVKAGIPGVLVHMGFLPHCADDPIHKQMVEAMGKVADAAAAKGLYVGLETGQETGEELLAFIKELDRPNIKINFDPANLILYGKSNPNAALRILGPHLYSCHAKDGNWPTEEGQLGSEQPLGEGQVNIPEFVATLKEVGFTGPIVIEREAGDDRIGDITRGRALLEGLIG